MAWFPVSATYRESPSKATPSGELKLAVVARRLFSNPAAPDPATGKVAPVTVLTLRILWFPVSATKRNVPPMLGVIPEGAENRTPVLSTGLSVEPDELGIPASVMTAPEGLTLLIALLSHTYRKFPTAVIALIRLKRAFRPTPSAVPETPNLPAKVVTTLSVSIFRIT
jgi:hypothetical protein